MSRLPAAAAVAAAVLWNLITLRATTLPVSYLDDSSVHEQMVRFATARFQAGHLPLTSWFPYLGLGSPHFLHYQSLPAVLTGALGTLVGPNAAFRWSLYLLLSLWPVSVYFAARLLGLPRGAAAGAALMAPFLASVPGVGYEQKAYLWIGYGVWTQLWASLTLPLAWALTWRAIRYGKGKGWAILTVALTVALHFETGYLALAPLVLWPLLAPRELTARLKRALLLALGVALSTAWVIVPLLLQRDWAARNEALQGTPLVNGYGLWKLLGWLLSGRVLDNGRLPVLTLLAGLGLIVALRRWRSQENGRALVVALVMTLLLASGRTTFGGLADLLPGGGDLFFRRFMMGTQLAALLLAGVGLAACGATLARLGRLPTRLGPCSPRARRTGAGAAAAALTVLILAPAWTQMRGYAADNASSIRTQRAADHYEGGQVDRLLAIVRHEGGGRVYAGMPSNWGADFTVGEVPVFKYLESRDADEVGYTLRTASLMTSPEYFFDERNPSDYLIFGIRFLILPQDRPAPVPATPLALQARYRLWRLSWSGYAHVVQIGPGYAADRTNVGRRSIPFLHSTSALTGRYPQLSYGRASGTAVVPPLTGSAFRAGSLSAQQQRLADGAFSARVSLTRPAAVLLTSSLDHGWRVTVDGRPRPVVSVAPALIAVRVPAGSHLVAFRYHGYGGYGWLGLLVLVSPAVALVRAVLRRRDRRARSSIPHRATE